MPSKHPLFVLVYMEIMPILFTSYNETGHIKWDQGDVSFIH